MLLRHEVLEVDVVYSDTSETFIDAVVYATVIEHDGCLFETNLHANLDRKRAVGAVDIARIARDTV